ncbi:MAG: HEAT repeat domain-containing protein [Theionarchaea archaeon]|nr:HEAT repeat domain-containing protein [Theionarchaea archaeon]
MLEQLAQLLKTRKGKYILFLGAGASVTSGGKTTNEIVTDIVEKFELDSSDPWKSFCTFLKRKSENERFDILSEYFENMNPSVGYEILAKLIEEGYFRLILTTNFDYMLEEALNKTNLVLNRDYFVCIIGEGKERILIKEIEDESMIRIVKLHGDYKRKILPFTEEETFQFKEELEECLKRLTREGIVFVGYSGMDRDVLKCLSRTGGSVWWVNPSKVTAETTTAKRNSDEYSLNEDIYEVLIIRKSHENFIWGDYGKSDIFFENIYERISVRDINSFCDQFKFGATRYRKMKDLFEPPHQYEEMKHKLNEHKVLLILGEAHLGKTYTALNLLYDYYAEGFNVDFRSELKREKMQQELMYQWENLLKPNTVIYLEDPFGKTEPENVQTFRSELKRIIQRIQNSESMVILTSRLNIFREVGDPEEYPMIVELMKQDRSYDLEKRKRILDKLVMVYKPKWRELLNEVVDGSALKEWIAKELTEPHNIELFVEKSLNTMDIGSLLERIKESKEILEVFRKEIERSTLSEKIFFYLCHILQGWGADLEYLKRSYSKVVGVFGLDVCEYDIDKLLKRFGFRVEIYEGNLPQTIKFSHPDFSKVIEESFKENACVIGRILEEMAKDEDSSVRGKVAEVVGRNFVNLPEDYRRLLFELARDEDSFVRILVATTVGNNFESLPEDYRRLLFELARDEDSSVRGTVAWTVVTFFKNLPEDYRRLLFELAKDEDSSVRIFVATTVGNNFESLPEDYRRLLFILLKDEATKVKKVIAIFIAQEFEDLPPEYQGILKEFKSDSPVLESLREWIEKNEEKKRNEETIKILRRELDM